MFFLLRSAFKSLYFPLVQAVLALVEYVIDREC